jgi:membrane associated rhomboid family serine protease
MITYILLAINIGMSLMGFQNRNFFEKYLFRPYNVAHNRSQWYTVFTHTFLHANFPHLLFNMIALYSFGPALEKYEFARYFGGKAEFYYILLYVGAIMVSSLPALEKYKDTYAYAAVGASGAVSAVVFSFILINPKAGIGFMFIPIPIPAWIFGALFMAYSWYMSKHGRDNIGHDAHLWGGLFGLALTLVLHPAFFSGFINQILTHS